MTRWWRKAANNRHSLTLLAYALLTLVFTWPLAQQIGVALPGRAPDTYLYIWNLEWVRRALFEFGVNPFFTHEIYYPTGISLYFHTLILGSDFLTLPLQLAFGAPSAYMVMTLVMFVLTGYGAYLLAYDLVRQPGPAFLAGLIFTFSPYHLAHLNYAQFNLMALQWIPLVVLAVKKYLDRPAFRSLFLALVFLVWISLTDWYYTLYAVLLVGLYVLYRALRARSFRPLAYAILLAASYLILLAPLFVGMYSEVGSGAVDPLRALKQADRFSADLLSFFVPTSLHPLWGAWVAPLVARFPGGLVERSIFLGYIPLALGAWAIWRHRNGTVLFWLLAALVFAILALGPTLHIAGETEFGPNQTEIALPAAVLYQLPVVSTVMNIARSISRFSVITLLSVALLAAFGLRTLLEHVSPRRASLLTLAACLGVGLEFVVLPIPTTPLDVPAVIETWRADPERFAILDLPPDYKTGGEAMYYWTIHRKPTVIGYHSQIVPYSLIDGVTAVRALVSPAPDILVKPQLTAAEVLNFFNIRYAALHKSAQEEDVRRIAVQLNEQWSSGAVISDDPALTVYAVPQTPLPSLVVMFDQALSQAQQTGWDQASPFGDGRIWRWMRNNGRVLLYTQTGGQLNLQVDATSLARPRRLVIRVNDEKVHSTRVLPDRTRHISVEGIRLQAGTNSLSFHSVEPPEQPSALGLNDDDRYLSIAFSQLSLQIE